MVLILHQNIPVTFSIVTFVYMSTSFATTLISENGYHCGGLKSCVRCDKGGGTTTTITMMAAAVEKNGDTTGGSNAFRCLKCSHFIEHRTRKCVEKCPTGYIEKWSDMTDYMGRMCMENDLLLIGMNMSGQKLSVMMGAAIGILICLVIIGATIVYLKYRKRKTTKHILARQSLTLGHLIGTHRSQESDDSERPEFLKQLAYLRPDAPVFLAMLNETRRQVRELKKPNRQNSAMQAYRPVLKDLSRILILLNKPENRIGLPPADWETLLAWGERVLRRFKKQNPNQLPLEDQESPNLDLSPYPTHLTTFSITSDCKSQSASTSTSKLQQLAINAFDKTYDNQTSRHSDNRKECSNNLKREESSSLFAQPALVLGSSCVDVESIVGNRDWNAVSGKNHTTILLEWNSVNFPCTASCYPTADEDDYYTLGFRPQDEITTEL